MTFTDKLRSTFGNLLNAIGGFLLKIGLKPNLVTVLGMVGNIVAGFLLSQGYIRLGGWIVLLIARWTRWTAHLPVWRGIPSLLVPFWIHWPTVCLRSPSCLGCWYISSG
jgi:hypothetical protein